MKVVIAFALGVIAALPIAVRIVGRRMHAQREAARSAYARSATGYPAGQNVAYAADDIQYVDTSD